MSSFDLVTEFTLVTSEYIHIILKALSKMQITLLYNCQDCRRAIYLLIFKI